MVWVGELGRNTYVHTYIQGTAFIMGCCWSLTRPYAALVLFLIATSGALICPTGTWPLVALWMGMSVGVFLFYFVFLPDADEVRYTKALMNKGKKLMTKKTLHPNVSVCFCGYEGCDAEPKNQNPEPYTLTLKPCLNMFLTGVRLRVRERHRWIPVKKKSQPLPKKTLTHT